MSWAGVNPGRGVFLDNPFALAEGHRVGGTDAQMNALYAAEWPTNAGLTVVIIRPASCLAWRHFWITTDEVRRAWLRHFYPSVVLDSTVEDVFARCQAQGDSELRIVESPMGFDKGPERLLAFAKAIKQSDLRAKLVLVGRKRADSNEHGRVDREPRRFNCFISRSRIGSYTKPSGQADVVIDRPAGFSGN